MALLGNRSVLLKSPGRFFGGSTVSDNRSNFGTQGSTRGRYAGGFPAINATPSGYRPPYSWIIAIKNGEMSSTNQTALKFSTSGTAYMGLPGTGSADISISTNTPAGELIVSGSGSAAISILANTPLLTASINGNGSASFTVSTNTPLLGAIAGLNATATVTFSASLVAYAVGLMEGSTIDTSVMTNDSVASAVWDTILSLHQTDGSAGKALSSAGAAADPLLGVVEGTLTLRDVQRIVLAVLAGQVTGAGTGTETFKGQAGESRVVSVVDNDGNRSSVTLDAA